MPRSRRIHRFARPWVGRTVALSLGLTAGCQIPRPPADLVTADRWQKLGPDGDPFAELRPASVFCDDLRGYGLDELAGEAAFEIQTGWCNYLTVGQPLLSYVDEGDTIEVRLWHFELEAPVPAEAYVGLAIGPTVVWEQTVPIPSPSGLVEAEFEATVSADRATPVAFHLHNHGKNSWQLLSIRVY